MKPVPYDDRRLEIAAKDTLKTWEEEEIKALRKAEVKAVDDKNSDSYDESVGEQLCGVVVSLSFC